MQLWLLNTLTETKGNYMTRNVEFYVNRANEKFEAGFTSMASQKDALQNLGHAYDILKDDVRKFCLTFPREDRTEQQDNVYYSIPHNLHQWKAKHTSLVLSVFPHAETLTTQIENLVELRETIKSAEIVKVERKANDKVATITKTIHEMIALRKSQFETGMKLCEVFGNLPVSMNWHYVVNQHGTSFIRVFYYMNGKLTPLNMICYIIEQNDLKK
jgi:hypothetical protein